MVGSRLGSANRGHSKASFSWLMEFDHLLDQSGQARRHHRLTPFVFDKREKPKLVHPLRLNMHIHQEPLLLRVLP
jgi:hypothetical protein